MNRTAACFRITQQDNLHCMKYDTVGVDAEQIYIETNISSLKGLAEIDRKFIPSDLSAYIVA